LDLDNDLCNKFYEGNPVKYEYRIDKKI